MAFDPTQVLSSLPSPFPTPPEAEGIINPKVSGNFVTPEQAKQMRLYADALSKNALTMPVKNGWQGLAQMANSVMGGVLGGYADKQQRDIINEGTARSTPVIDRMTQLTNGNSTGGNTSSSESTASPMAVADTSSNNPIEALKSNIANKLESGGKYDALGPVTSSGDRAYGKYQVMGNNIPAWTKEVLGREMTPQEFLADKDAQEKVTTAKLSQAYQQTGSLSDAASIWFTGRPLSQGGAGATDHNGKNPLNGAQYAKIATAGLTPPAIESQPPVTPQSANRPMTYDAKSGRVVYKDTGLPPTPEEVAASRVSPQELAKGAPTQAQAEATASPSVGAYAPNNPAPAAAAINNSAPAAPSPTIPPATTSGGASPYQIAALRGRQGMSPAMMASVFTDPTVPQNVKDSLGQLIAPQVVQGPFGTSSVTSFDSAVNGNPARPFTNMGAVQQAKIGKLELPVFTHMDNKGNVTRTPLGPGGSFNINGGQPASPPPANQGGGVASATAPNTAPAPYASSTPSRYGKPIPTNGDINDLNTWANENDAAEEAAKSDFKSASDAAAESRKTIPAIQANKSTLSQVKGYMEKLAQVKDPNTAFGELSPQADKILNIMSQLGFKGNNLREALSDKEAIKKGLATLIAAQSQALEGNNGKALAAGIELSTQSSPNEKMSYPGIVKTMNSIEKVLEYRQNYELAKQKWVAINHNFNGFDEEWTKGIQGGQSSIPTARPYTLTDSPIDTHTFSDGVKRIKVPSTKNGGFDWVPAPKDEK